MLSNDYVMDTVFRIKYTRFDWHFFNFAGCMNLVFICFHLVDSSTHIYDIFSTEAKKFFCLLPFPHRFFIYNNLVYYRLTAGVRILCSACQVIKVYSRNYIYFFISNDAFFQRCWRNCRKKIVHNSGTHSFLDS